MGPITPARLKPGMTLEKIAAETPRVDPSSPAHALIAGKALIFWDPARPGKKRDAIDTDQITPADDCVSESLETLDARWKAGAFRYLWLGFRGCWPRHESSGGAGA